MERITRRMESRIITSGYTDRFLRNTVTYHITEGDYLTTGYELTFNAPAHAMQHAISYLEQTHNLTWEQAYHVVNSSPLTINVPWQYRGTLSGTGDVKSIESVLKILNGSMSVEVRTQLAATVQLSKGAYYAICTGLYRCNERNRLLARHGLRPGTKVLVQPPGFDLDTEFDLDSIRAALVQIAVDPGRYYSEAESHFPNEVSD